MDECATVKIESTVRRKLCHVLCLPLERKPHKNISHLILFPTQPKVVDVKINLQYVVSKSRLINFIQNSGEKTVRLNSIKMKYLSGYHYHIFNLIKHFSSFYLIYQAPSTWGHLPVQKA